MLFLAILVLAESDASPEASANPLAPANNGQLQCYEPDDQKHTCRSIASYRQTGAGTYANTATIVISSTGPITLETITPVTVKAGAVCGSIRVEDINAGILRVSGRPLPQSQGAPILAQIAQSMEPLIDKEICTSYEKSRTGTTAKAKIDGVYRKDADQRVSWIEPSAGYIVSP